MVEPTARIGARGDMDVVQEELGIFDTRKALAHVEFAGADGLDLRASQLDAAFVGGENVISVASEAVVERGCVIGARAFDGGGADGECGWRGREAGGEGAGEGAGKRKQELECRRMHRKVA